MHLTFHSLSFGDVVVVHCKGKMTLGEGLDQLSTRISGLLGQRRVLLDLGGVEAVDAAGLGMLAEMAALAARSGRELSICNVPHQVADLISLTHLDEALGCYETERDGLASYLGISAFWRAS